MSDIRKIDIVLDERVETGPLQIGDDWPGTFIRGDNSSYFAFVLEDHLRTQTKTMNNSALWGLLETLKQCRV